MRKRLVMTALAAALLASLAGITAAGAAPKAEPTAKVVGHVKMNEDGTGTVKAHYICTPGADWHLWVSAKQTADGSRDEWITQGSTGFGDPEATPPVPQAPIWLQSHPISYVCDGKWHTQKFTIDTNETFPGENGEEVHVGRGELVKGYAWVQFCLIKGGSETEEPAFFLVDQDWRKVR